MPKTLQELKSDWFIDPSSSNKIFGIIPQQRYSMSNVSVCTDGNSVTPLIDGEVYAFLWKSWMDDRVDPDDEVLFTGCFFDNINTLGYTPPVNYSNVVSEVTKAANNRGVHSRFIINDNIWTNAPIIMPSAVGDLMPIPAPFELALAKTSAWITGVHHSKYVVFRNLINPLKDQSALVGSVDFSFPRLDRPAHLPVDAFRAPGTIPSHDFALHILGPAAVDLENAFIDRWNDPPLRNKLNLTMIPSNKTRPTQSIPPGSGTISIQVLQTYAKGSGHSWSQGDFTNWAAYINAVTKANHYIYIEDQYFVPFGEPPYISSPAGVNPKIDAVKHVDIIYQLGQAILRGVKVIVVLPDCKDVSEPEAGSKRIRGRRDYGIEYLRWIESMGSSGGQLIVATPYHTSTPVYVHAKLLICDDEYVLAGSANVNRKSQTTDGEMSVGLVDSAGNFARTTRIAIWDHHLSVSGVFNGDINHDINEFASLIVPADQTYNGYRLKEYLGEGTLGASGGAPMDPDNYSVDASSTVEAPGEIPQAYPIAGWNYLDEYHGPDILKEILDGTAPIPVIE